MKKSGLSKKTFEKISYEEIGLFPRSFSRVFDRFIKQLFNDVENLVLQEYRFYRYLFLTTVKCLFILLLVPFLVNLLAKNYLVRPLTEYLWNTKQSEIFLNAYQQKHAFSELKYFEEKLYFESLVSPISLPSPFLQSKGQESLLPTDSKGHNQLKKIPYLLLPEGEVLMGALRGNRKKGESKDKKSKIFFSRSLSSKRLIPTLPSYGTEEHLQSKGLPTPNLLLTKLSNGVFPAILTKSEPEGQDSSKQLEPRFSQKKSTLESSDSFAFSSCCVGGQEQEGPLSGFLRDKSSSSSRLGSQNTPLMGAPKVPPLEEERFSEKNLLSPLPTSKGGIPTSKGGIPTSKGGIPRHRIDELLKVKKLSPALPNGGFSEKKKNRIAALQLKTVELAITYNNQSIEAITNFFADLMSVITFFFLLVAMEIPINISKSFLLEVFFGLDDSKKSLLILLVTDLLVGYHSDGPWAIFFESLFNHYGLPESQTGIFLLVATLPVLLDVLFKYLIFRHLNRASPATVATYHAMIE